MLALEKTNIWNTLHLHYRAIFALVFILIFKSRLKVTEPSVFHFLFMNILAVNSSMTILLHTGYNLGCRPGLSDLQCTYLSHCNGNGHTKSCNSLIQVRHQSHEKLFFGWKAPTAWARIWPDLLLGCSIKKIFTATWSLVKECGCSVKLCCWNLQRQSWAVPHRTCPAFLGLGSSALQRASEILPARNCTFSTDKLLPGPRKTVREDQKSLNIESWCLIHVT